MGNSVISPTEKIQGLLGQEVTIQFNAGGAERGKLRGMDPQCCILLVADGTDAIIPISSIKQIKTTQKVNNSIF